MRFTSKLSALAFATAGLAASLGAQAQSIDVRVIGSITPPACTPTLAGGGVVDYGNIAASTLNMTGFNRLPERTVAFSITCDAPTTVAVHAVDNRAASRVPGITSVIGAAYNDTFNFGLGTVAGKNVGGYVLRMRQLSFSADGVDMITIVRANPTAIWQGNAEGGVIHSPNSQVSWGAPTRPPAPIRNLTGNLSVEAVLNRGDALPLGDDVPLDGLATLELVYL